MLKQTEYMPNAQPKRCTWVNVDQLLMREYHDREWGVPTHDDRTHFEFPDLASSSTQPVEKEINVRSRYYPYHARSRHFGP